MPVFGRRRAPLPVRLVAAGTMTLMMTGLLPIGQVRAATEDGHAPRAAGQRPSGPAGPASPVSTADRAPTVIVPPGDEIVLGSGDLRGWHVYAAASGDGWRWHLLATLRPGGSEDEKWIGQQCQTGDGRWVAAVVAPWHANNSATGMDSGGAAYVIDAHTGAVRPVAYGVSLAYFSPGCGAAGQVAFTSYLGGDGHSTRITVVDAATGARRWSTTVAGELTSAVPVGAAAMAARGASLVRLDSRRTTTVGTVDGQAFDLRPNQDGGVDVAAGSGDRVTLWRLAGSTLTRVGGGRRGQARVLAGRGGHNLIAGWTGRTTSNPLRALPTSTAVGSASIDGGVLIAQPGVAEAAGTVTLQGTADGAPVTSALPAPGSTAVTVPPDVDFAGPAAQGANVTDPTCAVPRNDLWNQVPQPNSAEIDWAIQQAVRGRLVVGNIPARPAGAENYKLADSQPLPAHYPNQDFPQAAIAGHPGAPVPPQVLYGIFAQESNWNQASWHALAGYGGNPLVANYYGSTDPTDPTDIDYDNADCGYGLGQLTDIMRTGALAPSTQVAVATDYAENIAAADQALVTKWNQLAGLGVTMNDGDPSKLENWYAAIWAYNSGVHTGAGADGLGWFNNPANPIYRVDRPPFLRSGYTDATHPQDWPYQEKVFGWMETAQTDPNYLSGRPTSPPTNPLRYAGVGPTLDIPGPAVFCSPSVNSCDPATIGSGDPCPSESSACWWSQTAQWVNCATSCTSGSFTVDSPTTPEPVSTDRGVPCLDLTGLTTNSVIVDDSGLASQNPGGLDPNVVGCPTTPSGYRQAGTLELDSDNGNAGEPGSPIGPSSVAAIDLHQLGAGFAGHIWFTHTRPDSDRTREVVARWTPQLSSGLYRIRAYVPDTGGTTTDADYQIHLAPGYPAFHRTVDQSSYSNQWVNLGAFALRPGSFVTLGSVTAHPDSSQGSDIAVDALSFTPIGPARTVPVTATNAYSFSDGWGTSLAWWAEVLGGDPVGNGAAAPGWSDADRKQAEQLLFGAPQDGNLGLTVARYNIGASPSPWIQAGCGGAVRFHPGAAVPSPQQAPGISPDVGLDSGQLAVLKESVGYINQYGRPIVEAFANSPPYWMTDNKCPIGDGVPTSDSLPPSQYQAYVDFLGGVVRSLQQHGVAVDTVEPFNEPDSFPWGVCTASCQEGANFAPGTQDDVLSLLCAALAGTGVRVSAPDGNTVDETIDDVTNYGPGSRACLGQLNTHGYRGTAPYDGAARPDLAATAVHSGEPLWMSEFGTGGSDTDMDSAIVLSRQIAKDLQYLRPTAWVYWQGVEGPNGWGLLQSQVDFPTPSQAITTKRFHALGQYSRFIRPGFQILTVEDPTANGGLPNCTPGGGSSGCAQATLDVAAYNPDGGRIVLTATNDQDDDIPLSYDLGALRSQLGLPVGSTAHVYRTTADQGNIVNEPDLAITGTELTDVQPAKSITTYVIDPPAGARTSGPSLPAGVRRG